MNCEKSHKQSNLITFVKARIEPWTYRTADWCITHRAPRQLSVSIEGKCFNIINRKICKQCHHYRLHIFNNVIVWYIMSNMAKLNQIWQNLILTGVRFIANVW